MSRSNFRRLKRIELYEIMLAQSKEIDRLRDELAKANEKLENQIKENTYLNNLRKSLFGELDAIKKYRKEE